MRRPILFDIFRKKSRFAAEIKAAFPTGREQGKSICFKWNISSLEHLNF